MRYISSPDFRHDGAERIGVLLVNTGTPDSLSVGDVRRYLAAFLGDPRVIEAPRLPWLAVLHGFILRTRPRASRARYRRIWTERGSPLTALSQDLRTALSSALAQRVLAPFSVELAMLYSSPGVGAALGKLRQAGAQRVLVLPLYPQYCGATTGAVYDQVGAELARWRWLPELRYVSGYHDHPGYIEALRGSVLAHWEQHGRPQHLLMSFHGIPESYFNAGDPYFCMCHKTARLLADELMLQDNNWSVSFQSRVGPARWLQPYTYEVMRQLPARGITDLGVLCPGFAIDCLETLEEIDMENRAAFLAAGGRRFSYLPALNAAAGHARFLADLIAQHSQGWTHDELGFSPAGAPRGTSA
ncbi:MAG TPA: ferrochelatase [Steroidobacteraceae bacterium]|nr:ferrochelatase [Steroidobacteraceae bacterium]